MHFLFFLHCCLTTLHSTASYPKIVVISFKNVVFTVKFRKILEQNCLDYYYLGIHLEVKYQSLPYPLHLYQKNTVVSTVQYKAVFCNAFILHRIHNKAFSPLLQQNVNEGSKKHSSLKNEKSTIFRRCSAVYLKRQNINRGAGFLQMVLQSPNWCLCAE